MPPEQTGFLPGAHEGATSKGPPREDKGGGLEGLQRPSARRRQALLTPVRDHQQQRRGHPDDASVHQPEAGCRHLFEQAAQASNCQIGEEGKSPYLPTFAVGSWAW